MRSKSTRDVFGLACLPVQQLMHSKSAPHAHTATCLVWLGLPVQQLMHSKSALHTHTHHLMPAALRDVYTRFRLDAKRLVTTIHSHNNATPLCQHADTIKARSARLSVGGLLSNTLTNSSATTAHTHTPHPHRLHRAAVRASLHVSWLPWLTHSAMRVGTWFSRARLVLVWILVVEHRFLHFHSSEFQLPERVKEAPER
jgi:hypothetical protein